MADDKGTLTTEEKKLVEYINKSLLVLNLLLLVN